MSEGNYVSFSFSKIVLSWAVILQKNDWKNGKFRLVRVLYLKGVLRVGFKVGVGITSPSKADSRPG